MARSFTKFKDRTWFMVDRGTKYLATAPGPAQAVGYFSIRGLLSLAYYLPGAPLRQTASSLSIAVSGKPAAALYGGFADRFILALKRMELLRLGRTEEIDELLTISDRELLENCLSENNGVLMVMPHCHASVVMVRGLAARYPTLMLIREPATESRAKTQRPYYEHIGCDLFETRRSSDALVARAVLTALRQGKIVIGVVDRIKEAPAADEPVRKNDDTVRAMVFGEPAGFPGWPARFAAKCNAPILPVMAEQDRGHLTMHFGEVVRPVQPVETTQLWVSGLEKLIRRFPADWGFVYDRHWARLLRRGTTDPKPD